MNPYRAETVAQGVDTPPRKKRLGQYFTGQKLSRLLAALSDARLADSIIDPMSGTGDMLLACAQSCERRPLCAAIEIDPVAHRVARERLMEAALHSPTLILGNAFDRKIISQLPSSTFDLVITNPPYVRYQSFSEAHEAEIRVPSAVEIRSSLLDLADANPNADSDDRNLFKTIISSYSGLSDLAVPSWLLCAMLTKVGGRLAMVVPEAWLSRDYAQVIRYLLLRSFQIEFIVEDAQAVWFPDALVKTTLLIAQRTSRRASAFDWDDEGYLSVRIDGRAMNEQSIVGNIFPNAHEPEITFSLLLKRLASERRDHAESLFSAAWIPLRHEAVNLQQSMKTEQWLTRVETCTGGAPKSSTANPLQGAFLPQALNRWLGNGAAISLTTLEQLGIGVGQGLRTGANRFFYVTALRETREAVVIEPCPIFGIKELRIPPYCAAPVLRKQSELRRGFLLDASALTGRVLTLQQFALHEDLIALDDDQLLSERKYRPLPDDLANLVRRAADVNIGTSENPLRIPDLSAVRTNVRAGRDSKAVVRFWYMLPPFARRHRPDLFVARVNGAHPKTILNSDDPALIDANFSTLWIEPGAVIDKFAVLAVLNSAWSIAAMELMGSVMGGGALKLEAAHLRRLPIPKLASTDLMQLSALGRKLATAVRLSDEPSEIDAIIVKALLGPNAIAKDKVSDLANLKRTQLDMRTRMA